MMLSNFMLDLDVATETATIDPRKLPVPKILAWSDSPEWDRDVANTASTFESALCAPVTLLTAPAVSLDDALAIADEERYVLIVLHVPDGVPLPAVLERTSTPLVLVRGHRIAVQHILVALRGIASDERMLDWIAPFVWWHSTNVSLIPLTSLPFGSGALYHTADPVGRHLQRFLRRLETDGVQIDLRFRQGDAVRQVVEEIEWGRYDLLAIAAEGRGSFVGRLLAELERRGLHAERPVLIVKPNNTLRYIHL